uniref:Uncharacterized protein n=1 Tax=Anguilla anguilla TaxID=7936 RepID=A0A0E9Y0F1_ANGAN
MPWSKSCNLNPVGR